MEGEREKEANGEEKKGRESSRCVSEVEIPRKGGEERKKISVSWRRGGGNERGTWSRILERIGWRLKPSRSFTPSSWSFLETEWMIT